MQKTSEGNNNKDIQRMRTMSYFVNAANRIIEEEGIEALTVRKVAALAGYNVATVYNYFENLEYLVGFASIKYLRDYHLSLKNDVEPIKDPRERFLMIWKKFIYYSFRNPKIYRAIFFTTPKFTLCELFDYYFRMFPEELETHSIDLESMMRGCTLRTRNMSVLRQLLKRTGGTSEGFNIEDMNEMMIYLYQGMLYSIIDNNLQEPEIIALEDKFMDYIENILSLSGI